MGQRTFALIHGSHGFSIVEKPCFSAYDRRGLRAIIIIDIHSFTPQTYQQSVVLDSQNFHLIAIAAFV